MWCKSCDDGDDPNVLDIDGVRSSISGTPGCWAHAYEDDWWPCQRKAAEEHAIVDKLPKTADGVTKLPGDIVWRHGEQGVEKRNVQWSARAGYQAWYGIMSPPVPVEECHSTREAAETARKEGD